MTELGWNPVDEVELDFTFHDSASVPDCVWAIVKKTEIKDLKASRWDLVSPFVHLLVERGLLTGILQSFARTTDHPSLPASLTVMSGTSPAPLCMTSRTHPSYPHVAEFADITDNLMKAHGGFSLASVLSNPAVLPYFRSLSLTDQPRIRPLVPLNASQRSKHLILSLAVPPSSASTVTVPLVDAAFKLVDVVSGAGGWGIGKGSSSRGGQGLAPSLRPETRSKLRTIREKLEKEIKEEAVKEQREEAEAEKAAAKKKAEDERLSKLSPAEQKKVRSLYRL